MLDALQAYVSLFQADVHRAAELSDQALAALPREDLFVRSLVAWISGLARLADGDQEVGRQALEDVVRSGREIGNQLIAVTSLCYLAKLQMRQGHLQQAQLMLGRALELATDREGRRLPIASEALIGLGRLELEWNDLSAAAEHLTAGVELAKQWSEAAAFDAYYPLMRVRLAQGDLSAAQQALDAAWEIAHRAGASEMDVLVAELQRARLRLVRGEIAEAMRWAEGCGLVPDEDGELAPEAEETSDHVRAHLRKYESLLVARLLLIQGRPQEALDHLISLLVQAQELIRTDLVVEVQILQALAHQALGDQTQALASLAEALSLAEPAGYRRVFLDEGEPMSRLLRQAASHGIAPAYVADLLTALVEHPPAEAVTGHARSELQPLIDPISARELEVLRLLETGLSNPEIAERLFVAVSTVRSHCKSIYGKLNVHSRWDAVQRAQELGLI
jgi:LuxR family maltose regulon positive regulatory protein